MALIDPLRSLQSHTIGFPVSLILQVKTVANKHQLQRVFVACAPEFMKGTLTYMRTLNPGLEFHIFRPEVVCPGDLRWSSGGLRWSCDRLPMLCISPPRASPRTRSPAPFLSES